MDTNTPDILIYGHSDHPVAVVEVKNPSHLAASQAMEVRRALLELDDLPWAKSFLLVVSQDKGFLWSPAETFKPDVRPAAVFEMGPVLRDYLTGRELDGHLRGSELELAVIQWLSDLSRGRGKLPSGDAALADFVARIRGARVEAVGSVL